MNTKNNVFIEFEEVSAKLTSLLKPLTTPLLNTVPFQNSWTAGQVADHLYKSYGIVDLLDGTSQKVNRSPDEKVWDIKNTFLDFTIRMESPVHIRPETGTIQKDTILNGLEKRISQFLTFKDQDLCEECLDFIIPEFGAFTRLEWIWFTTLHTYRHLFQLEKILNKIDVEHSILINQKPNPSC